MKKAKRNIKGGTTPILQRVQLAEIMCNIGRDA